MSSFKFKLNKEGVRDLLQSSQMVEVLEDHARATLSSLGEGYTSSTYIGKNRANVAVSAESFQAKRENSKNNTILKALR